jgi:acyl transferase domain-containing protein/acyl carrier protein
MSTANPEQLSPIKRALLAIEELQARLDAVEKARTEPIAIVGAGCRLPGGVHGPESFWRMLCEGVDAIGEVPADRWGLEAWYDPDPGTPGRMASRFGGFLEDVDGFDAAFFGLSPREAASMDPQQRLLLEVAWEALEDAGLAAERLLGSRTGVYVGMGSADHALLQALGGPLDTYASTGSNLGVAAGRVAYTLGLHGPVLALDAGCASSLVAVHLACQALRNGEADLALAGGVNALLSPYSSVAISQLRALAPDGRCKTFDAAADGFVRGEGCGLVVLKRLSRALADGDPIRAVIRGSAVNHGGRGTGLTAPNVGAQESVIRAALASAGVQPSQVGLVETHGTGTVLGDPIEVEALARVFGPGRPPRQPLVLGAVKTNLGHLEAAAGIAGLLKAAECLRHGEVPANLHLRAPNPHLALSALPALLPTRRTPLPPAEGGRVAGVSAFGVGGTNAHVVLAEAPPPPARPVESAPAAPYLLPLSARSPEALRALASSWGSHLRGLAEGGLADACYTASVRRSHHPHRLAVAFRTRQEALERLEAFVQGQPAPGLAQGSPRSQEWQGLAFVFPGQGSQWLGMGQRLLATEPTFRQALERCEQALRPHVDWSLLGQLRGEEPSRLESIDVLQPTLFSLQVALAALWRSWGVEPDAVVGHSMGEVAAAHVAGVLELEDAARIICLRSRLLRQVSGRGAMAVVELSPQQAQRAVVGLEHAVAVAVSNSPRSTVLAGEPAVLREVVARLEAQEVFCRWVKVDVASHSPQVDPLLEELGRVLAGVRPRAGRVPLLSTVTGLLGNGADMDAGYWVRNLREPVRFAEAVERLSAGGYSVFVEVSPHPVLLPAVRQGLEHHGRAGVVLPSLRREEDEQVVLRESLGGLYTAGVALDWSRLYPGGRCVPLPPYPWQHQRFARAGVGQPVAPAVAARERPDEGLYEVAWRERPRPAGGAVRPGAWVLLMDRGGVGEALARELESQGAPVLRVRQGEHPARVSEGHYEVRPDAAEDFARLLREGPVGPLAEVVHLWALDTPSLEQAPLEQLERAQQLACGSVALLVRALHGQGTPPARLRLVTRGACPVEASEPVAAAQAPLWGLGRALAAEHPELWAGLVDVDPTASAESAGARLAAELLGEAEGEDQVALRGSRRLVARLVRGQVEPGALPPLSEEGTYLVTGGLGGIGLQVARWLAEQGARHLVLLGRTPLPPREHWEGLPAGSREAEVVAALRDMEAVGARVRVAAVDVGEEQAMRALLESLAASGAPPVRGVMHAAGISELRPLTELEGRSLAPLLRAKVAGGLLLHRLLEAQPLDFFCLFSSGSALLGSPLLAAYAAGNAFLDALAHHRRARGLPALSVNWGFWSEVGIAARRGAETGRDYTPRGMEKIEPRRGLALLGRLMARGGAQMAVLPTRWEEWRTAYPSASRAPLFTELLGTEHGPAPHGAGEAPRPRRTLSAQELRAAAPAERPALLTGYLRGLVTEVLRLPPSTSLAEDEPLNRVGIDSLMALELKGRLQRELGVVLPAAVLLQGPTLAGLGVRLLELLEAAELVAAVRAGSAPGAEDADWESVTI